MPNTTPRYWYACVGEPVPLHSPETGGCKRLIIECRDPAVADDTIRDEIRAFVEFPAGTAMRWYDFKRIQIEEPETPASADRRLQIRIWHVAKDPAQQSGS